MGPEATAEGGVSVRSRLAKLICVQRSIPPARATPPLPVAPDRERSGRTPIIFLAADESDVFPMARAYALGLVDSLVKPLGRAILEEMFVGVAG